MNAADERRLFELCADLSLAEKVSLLTGRDFWSTHGIARIGLRPMTFSDGPAGIRGQTWDERDPSVNLPSPTALAATWDRDVARRYGDLLGLEARRRGVDVVLGPTVNLQRTPTSGRHHEYWSEDPLLTAELAAAYVDGIQRRGVGATVKHFICNDFETDRYTVDVVLSTRALHEVYLAAFETAVRQSQAWLVMSSYNSVNGVTATENDLLRSPLAQEWAFDGVVVGDWTAVRSLASARAHQDLAMPGPGGPWGDALVAAVRAGEVPESAVDRKVVRLLRLAGRLGALDGVPHAPRAGGSDVDGPGLAREVAAAGSVLLENHGVLPAPAAEVSRVVVVGQGARHPRTQGGGSATVIPSGVVSPVDGIRAAYPTAQVDVLPGVLVERGLTALPLRQLTNPATGEPGVHVRFLDETGELHREERRSSDLVWFGGDAPIARSRTVELETDLQPDFTGNVLLGVAAIGRIRVVVDGIPVLDTVLDRVGIDLGAALLAPPAASVELQTVVGERLRLRVTVEPARDDDGMADALGIRIGLLPGQVDDDLRIAEAVEASRDADLVVVVVGTSRDQETEGSDRRSLALPGRQDDLVRAIVGVNPRTVVVVNCGAPVVLPWSRDAGAVLQMWFAGQEMGAALGDLLTGAAEPGGRLPMTWPAREVDVPLHHVTPVDGAVTYREGIHVGHRLWQQQGVQPAYCFGHGLGYTSWRVDEVAAPPAIVGTDGGFTVHVTVTNTGARPGQQVIQVYASRPDTAIDRPVSWLAGFATAVVAPGEQAVVPVAVRTRTFAHHDGTWRWEPGAFTLSAGTSLANTPVSTTVSVVPVPDEGLAP